MSLEMPPTASPVSPDAEARIAIYKQKAIEGTLTLDDMKDAIILLRKGRMEALAATTKTKSGAAKKAPKAKIDAQKLLDDL